MAGRTQPALTTLAGLVLLAVVGCDAASPADRAATNDASADDQPTPQSAQSAQAEAGDDEKPSGVQPGPAASCPPGRPRKLEFTEPVTVGGGVTFVGPRSPVVDRTGTATVVYEAPGWGVRTTNDPPAPGDPQDPSPDIEDANAYGDPLAIDRAGNRTLAYLDFPDLVVTNQTSDSPWAETLRLLELGIWHIDVAVNHTGAAAVIWDKQSAAGAERLYAIYRRTADAPWTAPQRLPVRNFLYFDATIDDAGRILLVHDNWQRMHNRVHAIRRTADGRWSRPHLLTGDTAGTDRADHRFFRVAQSGNGAAVITHGPTDGDNQATDRIYTTRMNPNGTWRPPVLQPHRLGIDGLATDAHGRTLLSSWDDTTVWARWSRADGTWLEPFALAAGLDDRDNYARWGRWPDIAVNRRGDALATWATSRRTPDTWIRYQPAGHDWSRPRRLPTETAPQVLRTALGDCGHAAFTWTTTGPRKLHTMRALPSP